MKNKFQVFMILIKKKISIMVLKFGVITKFDLYLSI